MRCGQMLWWKMDSWRSGLFGLGRGWASPIGCAAAAGLVESGKPGGRVDATQDQCIPSSSVHTWRSNRRAGTPSIAVVLHLVLFRGTMMMAEWWHMREEGGRVSVFCQIKVSWTNDLRTLIFGAESPVWGLHELRDWRPVINPLHSPVSIWLRLNHPPGFNRSTRAKLFHLPAEIKIKCVHWM